MPGMGGFPKAVDVALQDQTTDPIISCFNQVTNSTTLSAAVAIDDLIIPVVSATGISIGSYIILFSPSLVRFTTFFVTAVNGLNITLDGPMDVAYPAGTFVDVATVDLAVNGSITTQVFGLRGIGAPPGVELSFDVTRLILQCQTTSAVTLGLFANIAALTNGLFLRKRDTRYKNILNFKTNDDIANRMFDFIVYEATNPAQGIDGFVSRLTFAGQNKIGVVIRLTIGEDLEFHIQDDLSAITRLTVIAEGHIVQD